MKINKNKQLKTTERFINEANIVHKNRYDYSLVNYKKSNLKIIIICKTHGQFEQSRLPFIW